ncbi:uncharacterized protein LOC106091357 isoform X1 [Stomoxys calcitrans]|uniref:uncharacterized protein LOC106091357 isoform X1 n=1 Tax=Stomoxys calcitrans TaxID=35570 RepID=UPI0027E3B075|nr:uncharacterized protein LOC106091357 isoform X1 [Stomoxys calcitrans]
MAKKLIEAGEIHIMDISKNVDNFGHIRNHLGKLKRLQKNKEKANKTCRIVMTKNQAFNFYKTNFQAVNNPMKVKKTKSVKISVTRKTGLDFHLYEILHDNKTGDDNPLIFAPYTWDGREIIWTNENNRRRVNDIKLWSFILTQYEKQMKYSSIYLNAKVKKYFLKILRFKLNVNFPEIDVGAIPIMKCINSMLMEALRIYRIFEGREEEISLWYYKFFKRIFPNEFQN